RPASLRRSHGKARSAQRVDPLELVHPHRTYPLRSDHAVGTDPEQVRKRIDVVAPGDVIAFGARDQPRELLAPREAKRLLRGLTHADAPHREAVGGVALEEALELGHLGAARATPAAPELHHERMSAQALHGHALTGARTAEQRQVELGSSLSDRQRTQRV